MTSSVITLYTLGHKAKMGVNEDVRSLGRRLDSIIGVTDTETASVVLDTGEVALITVVASSNANVQTQATIELDLYIDSISEANLLPGGLVVEEDLWFVQGPFYSISDSDGINTALRLFVWSFALEAHTLIVKTRARLIEGTVSPSPSIV